MTMLFADIATDPLWVRLLDKWGWPTLGLAFVGLCVVAVWRYLTKNDGWLDTIKKGVTTVFNRMTDFVEHVQKQGDQTAGALSETKQLLVGHDERSREDSRLVRNIHAGALEACDYLEQVIESGAYSQQTAREKLARVRMALKRED